MEHLLFGFVFLFFETGFPYLELTSLELCVDQAGLDLTNIHLPLPPDCWDKRRVPPPPGSVILFFFEKCLPNSK